MQVGGNAQAGLKDQNEPYRTQQKMFRTGLRVHIEFSVLG